MQAGATAAGFVSGSPAAGVLIAVVMLYSLREVAPLTTLHLCCAVLCRAARPDVLPPPVLQELSKLQDRIEPFSTPGNRA